MESRLIYESSKTHLTKIEWITNQDKESEWNYIGFEENLDETHFLEIINNYFEDNHIYFVLSRTESFEIEKKDFVVKILELYKNVDFLIWDMNFEKVIQFNKVGVYRNGIKAIC